MLSDGAWQLQTALVRALRQDGDLSARLGADKIYDAPPRAAQPPYIIVDVSEVEDWSTSTETGGLYRVLARVWSDQGGRREAFALAQSAEAAIQLPNLNLTRYEIINLRLNKIQLTRAQTGRHYIATLQFRVVLEPDV